MQTQTSPSPLPLQSLTHLLNEFSQLEPERCSPHIPVRSIETFVTYQLFLPPNRSFFIGSSHLERKEHSELAILERVVQLAAEAQGWTSDSYSIDLPGTEILAYTGHVYTAQEDAVLYTHATAEDSAIARLAAYLKALRGDFSGLLKPWRG